MEVIVLIAGRDGQKRAKDTDVRKLSDRKLKIKNLKLTLDGI
jgi:hypothetical protein